MKNILLFLLCFSAHAHEFSLVSPDLILLLHPEMQAYHFTMHSFYKADKNQLVENLCQEYRNFQAHEEQIRLELLQDFARQKKELLAQKRSSTHRVPAINKELLQNEAQRQKALNAYQQNHKIKTKQFLEGFFLSAKERNQKLAAMRLEIKTAISAVAKKQGLKNLLYDAADSNIPIQIEELPANNLVPHLLFAGNDLFLYSQLSPALKKRIDQDSKFIAAHAALINNINTPTTPDLLKYQNELMSYLRNRLQKKRVSEYVPNNHSINADVLQLIYEQHNIPLKTVAQIIEALR